jgi:hypothetical protein
LYQKTAVLYEGFDNIHEHIGNYLISYVYDYTKSICEEKDFSYKRTESQFLKHLPTHIPFNKTLSAQFKEKGITLEKLNFSDVSLWECTEDIKMNILDILKQTVHSILDNALVESGLKRRPLNTLIHFRCADTPFSKYHIYYLQRYPFLKESLEKINPPDKTVTLMNCSTHLSKKEEQDACALYTKYMSDYLESIGYHVNVRCNTNLEDFADMFYAKAVISTGGSYSFMSGFFGHGQFLSTEHILNGKTCTTKECDAIFIRGHNIMHHEVESYYDVDKVHTLLSVV